MIEKEKLKKLLEPLCENEEDYKILDMLCANVKTIANDIVTFKDKF